MKRFSIFLAAALMLMVSCQKAKELTYNSPDNIYFDFSASPKDRDSIIYTFAYEPSKARDTIFLPVRISGIRTSGAREFKLLVAEGSTALPGTHYEPLKEGYTIAADSGTYALPVILLNSDPMLSEKSVTLNLTLVETADFGLQITGLTTCKIVFSSKLEKPDWWNMWLGDYYSQVKHELFLIATGISEMTTSGLDAPMNLYYTGLLASMLNDPFGWVADHPDAGYVLELRSDSNYDFYNVNNPGKKIELRKNSDSGKYFFIDENGREVF